MGEIVSITLTLLLLATVALLFVTGTVYAAFNVLESFYLVAFDKPLYVHFYPIRKELKTDEASFLNREFTFYRNLPEKQKKYFRHRVHRFIKRYKFIGREGLEPTPEMQLKIAATWVMLTFGMRSYLPRIFEVIVMYPDIFESRNGNLHKGEFNPMFKAVVFSWKHFEEGFAYDNDNLNLGLHEFAHVLHFSCITLKRPGASGLVYADLFNKVIEYLNNPVNRQRLINLGYLRDYAYTNSHEFIAVVLEHFFETPNEFRQKLPELYNLVKKMINYRHNYAAN